MHKNVKCGAIIAVLLGTAFPYSPSSFAQESGPENVSSGGLEEIVVMARRRAESLQNVSLSVRAVKGDDLREQGIVNTQDVAAGMPNVSVNYGLTGAAFNIRGIGSNEFQTNLDSPVAIHVDEVYLSKVFMSSLFMFDIERVEVTSGPQGTLFGRNTTGGTVNFYTRRPTQELEIGGKVSYGNYDTFRGEGYISGPLTDKLSGRLSAFGVHQGDGYFRNLTLGETEGYDRKWAVRGQLAWAGEDTDVLFSAHYGRDTGTVFPYEGVGIYTPESVAAFNPGGGFGNIGLLTPCAQRSIGRISGADTGCVRGHDGGQIPGDDDPYTSNGHHKHDVDSTSGGGFLKLDHDLGSATLTSLSAFEYFERSQSEVGDGSPTYDGTWLFWYTEIKQYTQELRLTSNDSGRWDYVVGAFYQHDDLANGDYLTFGAGDTPALGGLKTAFDQSVDAIAFFTHHNVEVTPELKLVAGGRYNWERTSIDGGTCFGAGIVGLDEKERSPATGCLAVLSDSSAIPSGNVRKDNNVSFKLGMDWTPEVDGFESVLIYGNVSTGFRSGGFNAGFADSQETFTSLEPEKITSYEIGFKSETEDRTFRLNGSLFHYEFTDGFINVDTETSIVPITINAAKIKTFGAELSMNWLPVENLAINASGGISDAKIKTDATAAGIPLLNNRPVNAPKYTFAAGFDYVIPVGADMQIDTSVNANWRSAQFLETSNVPATRQDDYWLVNASLALSDSDAGWSLTAWVHNLTKSKYLTYVNDLPGFGWTLNVYGPPRTYGLTAGFEF